jgi:hypothetical protein
MAVHDHAVVQLLNALAAGAPERERQDRVKEAGGRAQHHLRPEARGNA